MGNIADLLCEMVAIPSVNPLHVGERSGAGGEAEMAEWLRQRCLSLGAEVEVETVEDGRPNLYARFEGTTDRCIAIDVHTDTVGVEHYDGDPFDGHVAQGRVWGRGSVDTKATLAVVLTVLEEFQAAGERPTSHVELIGTISEEGGGMLGAKALAARCEASGSRFEQLIVAEPTNCAPVYGHKGGFGLDLHVEGRAAHSSKPHLGINAVSAAARVVAAVDAEQQRLAAAPAPGTLSRGTVTATGIEGGLARNIVPATCELHVGRRVTDGEEPEQLLKDLTELMRAAALPARLKVQLANDFVSGAFFQSPDSQLVKTLGALSERSATVADYGTNALFYGDIADQIVVFGPGSIDQAHTASEWVEVGELELAARVYRALLRS